MTPGSAPLNVAVIGLGNAGVRHAEAYAGNKACKLRWFHDTDEAKAEALARDFGGVPVAKDYESILADGDVDIVSIASFDGDHFAQTIPALSKGKNLFVEKPLCRSREEVNAVKAAWKEGGRPALDSNLMSRGSPLYNWLATFVDRGGLGDIYAIDAEYWYGRLHKITDGWRTDVDHYSVMQGGAVHLMDVIFMLTGERPQTVTAVGNRICTEGTAFRYDDFVTATYRFPSSMIGRATANFGCVHRHQHILRVFGTRATFLLDDAGPRLHTARDNITSGLPEGASAAIPIDIPYRPDHKGDLIPPFIDRIVMGEDSEPLLQRNLDVISAIIAADEALESGKEKTVDYA